MMIPRVRNHRRFAVSATTLLLLAVVMAGCGGGSSNKNVVAQVNLTPATASVIAGQVTPLVASAVNSSGTNVATVFTFNTSNPQLVTISPSGQVCGGVWDTTFVTCNGLDAGGNTLSGTATVTASANGITSGPVIVSVHPNVTSVTVTNDIPANTCFSPSQTHQFTPHAFNNATDITAKVGDFAWISTNPAVVSIDANGLATARAPGLAQIVASAGTSSSPGVAFKTCMPVRLTMHVPGDPPGQPTVSATMNANDTKTLEVDMTDENGTVTNGVSGVTLLSNNAAVATIGGASSSATLTAISPGGAGVLAACLPPLCGAGINQPVYSNLFSVTVNGASPATTVYVASKDLAQVSTIIPIDTSKTPPTAGTQLTLPGHPNSFLFSGDGLTAYIGTDAGLVKLDTTANTLATVAPEAVGTVLAVSRDGNQVVISNAPNDPNPLNHRLRVFHQATGTLTTFILHNAVAAAFTPDGFKAYVGATDGNVYVFSLALTLQTLTPGGSFKSVTVLASGPLAFLANSAALNAFNVCNNSQTSNAPTLTAPQLLGSILNSDRIVALDTTGLNIETVNVGAPASGFCPPTVSYTNEFIDFLAGPFTANQLIVPGNAAHIVVLPAGRNQIFSAISGSGPGVATLSPGATEALSGGMTQDGNTLWVGVQGDHTLHRINLLTLADEFQIQPNVNGAKSTPDLVAVKPK
ncbi:MAG TPA: Ig-like domain-containing protein [Candidatus Angelobacter sp.]